ncbi:MAG: hypothetical protein JSW06_10165 [Thermoplasmatales archaeon]|nr:MAG: hypothetical protein JSW06_10165 [Thermoplasmatales archaeon]
MNKKIISIFVSMLLCVTVFTVTGAVNIENTGIMKSQAVTTDIFWEDNFDNYTLGPLHGQGGWESWDNNPDTTGYVTDNQSRSPSNSAEIAWFGDPLVSGDIVYQFSGVSSGSWILTAWQYVPSDMEGKSYYLLLNTYQHGGPYGWSLQLEVDATAGRISDFDNPDDWLPLITDDWAEIRVEINFDIDLQTAYYNDEELVSKAWGPTKNLGCIDLYADQSYSSSVYYDDFVLEGIVGEDPDLYCEGELHFGNVPGGATLEDSFTVQNIGGPDSLLDWEVVKEPSWGTWTFDPESGNDLPPGSPVTVQVTVVAPKQKDEYAGTIKIENKENPDDNCIIDVSMTTPRSQPYLYLQFFERLIQRFPVLELIFSHLLG